MKTPKILLLLFINLFILSIQTAFASSASIYYSDGSWSGRIIDADTKGPIEGAVVVAVWYRVYSTPTGDSSYFFDAVEALTDKDGKFFISQFKALNLLPIIRRIEGPDFIIYKPEYTAFPGWSYDYFYKYFPNSSLRVGREALAELFKKDVIVELRKLKTRDERLNNIPGGPTDVSIQKLPLFYKLINEERKNLGLEGRVGG